MVESSQDTCQEFALFTYGKPKFSCQSFRPQKDKGKIQFSLLSFFGEISSNCWLKLENKTKLRSQNHWPMPLQTQLGERNVFSCLLLL